jgi:hypothetical protein
MVRRVGPMLRGEFLETAENIFSAEEDMNVAV